MTHESIFLFQFGASLIAWIVFARTIWLPALARHDRHGALMRLAAPHMFRHLGLVFLVPGVVSADMPGAFAGAAAWGDVAAGVIAVIAVWALHAKWRSALLWTWLFNIVGLVDLGNALRQSEAIPHFRAAWYIPTMIVPLLLVTHFLMIRRLWTRA